MNKIKLISEDNVLFKQFLKTLRIQLIFLHNSQADIIRMKFKCLARFIWKVVWGSKYFPLINRILLNLLCGEIRPWAVSSKGFGTRANYSKFQKKLLPNSCSAYIEKSGPLEVAFSMSIFSLKGCMLQL